MTKPKSQDLRFKLYHQLEEIYHQFLDDLAEVKLGDGEIGRIAQTVMLSRQEALKHLVTEKELEAHEEKYSQDE